jgi:hypothetical protein
MLEWSYISGITQFLAYEVETKKYSKIFAHAM